MHSKDTSAAGPEFYKLVDIMAKLRAPGGCPWDREQTFDSIKPYTIEETYEVLDAIDRRDWADLSGELGDFILQAVFYAQMAAEAGHFTIEDSLRAINEKLIRRHPHIFSGETAATGDDVKKLWDEIKAQERSAQTEKPQGILDSVPRALPALVEAQQIGSRAARTGFDWENVEGVVEKIHEELREIEEARSTKDRHRIEDEIGDLLFAVVNLARFLKVDPEQALRGTNRKFRRRFAHIEHKLEGSGRKLGEVGLSELEQLWSEAKTLGGDVQPGEVQ